MGHTDFLPLSMKKFALQNSLFLLVLVFGCQQSENGLLIFGVMENKCNNRSSQRARGKSHIKCCSPKRHYLSRSQKQDAEVI